MNIEFFLHFSQLFENYVKTSLWAINFEYKSHSVSVNKLVYKLHEVGTNLIFLRLAIIINM